MNRELIKILVTAIRLQTEILSTAILTQKFVQENEVQPMAEIMASKLKDFDYLINRINILNK